MNINRQDQNYLKKLTVLYVEDDDDTREQFSEFLKRPVGRLITAANGAEGLEQFIKHSPDIVVTDILMPQMDGLTMAYEIRGIAPAVPIVVVTAFEQTDYLLRAINIGVDKYVTKPVNSYLLFECLLECSRRLRAEEQLKLQHNREIQAMWAKRHETVATLAGGIAHDYNKMLQKVFGYVALAKIESNQGSACYNYLEQVEQCSDEAQQLDSLLQSLVGADSEAVEPDSIMPLISQTIKDTLNGTSIELIADYPESIPTVRYVGFQLHQVIKSLAMNAVEAMPDGGSLQLAARSAVVTEQDSLALEPGPYLLITLTDTGAGISPEILPKIFDPYFSTKERDSRCGIGVSLALSQTIMMKFGGLITVESQPGKGSAFNVWLPVEGDQAPSAG